MTDFKTAPETSTDTTLDEFDLASAVEHSASGHVSEEERARHERFHQAVKRLLTEGSLEGTPVRPSKYAGGTYTKLLSAQELRFLLR